MECKKILNTKCKLVLENKRILAHILQQCTEEFQYIPIGTIADRCIEEAPHIGSVVDSPDFGENKNEQNVSFRAVDPDTGESVGVMIYIEAEKERCGEYPIFARAIDSCWVYMASHADEENLKKVYSIWLIGQPPESQKNTITGYDFREQHIFGKVSSEKDDFETMTVVMIGIGDHTQTDNSLLRMLDAVFSQDMYIPTAKQLEKELEKVGEEIGIKKSAGRICQIYAF